MSSALDALAQASSAFGAIVSRADRRRQALVPLVALVVLSIPAGAAVDVPATTLGVDLVAVSARNGRAIVRKTDGTLLVITAPLRYPDLSLEVLRILPDRLVVSQDSIEGPRQFWIFVARPVRPSRVREIAAAADAATLLLAPPHSAAVTGASKPPQRRHGQRP